MRELLDLALSLPTSNKYRVTFSWDSNIPDAWVFVYTTIKCEACGREEETSEYIHGSEITPEIQAWFTKWNKIMEAYNNGR